MPSVVTSEFVGNIHADAPPFSLIEQRNLISRLWREIRAAATELAQDPSRFLKNLSSAETKDAKRRQRIYIGLTVAAALHVVVLSAIAVFGVRTIFIKQPEADVPRVSWVRPNAPEKTSDSNLPRGNKDKGGGGGGDEKPLPATKGPTPQMSNKPQIVKPNAPHVVLPTIQLPPTIVGPDSSPPPQGIVLGIPSGVIADAPSPGPGKGGGLGGRDGSGAGRGNGPGAGKGDQGGSGGKGRVGVPSGSDDVKGPIPYNLIRNFPDTTSIVWLHRPTPMITPEAQANKVKGEVWLRATFGEDGKITDIVVIREVPFMTESAVEALARSTFRPATIKGRPVTLVNVPVRINVDVVPR
ncbi:MAG: energy transducer TonB [Blastocatellia bacterium]